MKDLAVENKFGLMGCIFSKKILKLEKERK